MASILQMWDSQYIENVNDHREFEDNTNLEGIYEDRTQRNRTAVSN